MLLILNSFINDIDFYIRKNGNKLSNGYVHHLSQSTINIQVEYIFSYHFFTLKCVKTPV